MGYPEWCIPRKMWLQDKNPAQRPQVVMHCLDIVSSMIVNKGHAMEWSLPCTYLSLKVKLTSQGNWRKLSLSFCHGMCGMTLNGWFTMRPPLWGAHISCMDQCPMWGKEEWYIQQPETGLQVERRAGVQRCNLTLYLQTGVQGVYSKHFAKLF